ncbi:MAG: ISAzo13 family transposase [Vulcanimicrobiaceae bacterium]
MATSHDAQGRAYRDHICRRRLRYTFRCLSESSCRRSLLGDLSRSHHELSPTTCSVAVNSAATQRRIYGACAILSCAFIVSAFAGVSVGTDHDTAAFAVQTIRRWWQSMGRQRYPHAKQLFITADGGGSNGHRVRLWKLELSRLAQETGLEIHVSHFPPGTSKWNKIEHRLFSFITMNWRGRPLISHEVIVNLIASTRTRSGQQVHAELDSANYPKGVVVSDEGFAAISIDRNEFHGDWDYCICPT